MMTVGHVLDFKNAGHPGCSRSSSGASPVQLQDPVSTLEYKAWKALQANQVSESQQMVRRLLDEERARASDASLSDAQHLLSVESRIRNILVAASKVTEMNKFKVAESVTEFLWDEIATLQ